MDRDKHRDARSELIASAWLLAQGFEVFRNVSQHGEIDIIAVQDGVTTFFDVKTMADGAKARLSQAQFDCGTLPLCVYPDGRCEIDYAACRTGAETTP